MPTRCSRNTSPQNDAGYGALYASICQMFLSRNRGLAAQMSAAKEVSVRRVAAAPTASPYFQIEWFGTEWHYGSFSASRITTVPRIFTTNSIAWIKTHIK